MQTLAESGLCFFLCSTWQNASVEDNDNGVDDEKEEDSGW